jgi:hypothetical protein
MIALCNFITNKAYYHPDKCTLNGHGITQPVELRNHILLFQSVCTSGQHKNITNFSSQLAQNDLIPITQAGNQRFKIKLVLWIHQLGGASPVHEQSLDMHVQTHIKKDINIGLHTYRLYTDIHAYISLYTHTDKYQGLYNIYRHATFQNQFWSCAWALHRCEVICETGGGDCLNFFFSQLVLLGAD